MTTKNTGVGFECFSNTEEDVFLGLFGAGSDSEDDDASVKKADPEPEVVEEPFDANSYTEAVYRIPESAQDGTADSNIEVVLIERKHLGIAHQLWPAAGFLCEFFLKHKKWLQDECSKGHTSTSGSKPPLAVLELGAGIGLCGMYLGALMQQTCDTKVLLTDLSGAIDGLNENINRNDLASSVQARVLSWGDSAEFDAVMAEFNGQTPLVIAADCVYWECLYEPLFQTIKSLMSKGCKVIISHVRRWKKDGKFFAMCKKAGYSVSVWVEDVKTVPAEHTGVPTRQVTRIYCIENSASLSPAGAVVRGDVADRTLDVDV